MSVRCGVRAATPTTTNTWVERPPCAASRLQRTGSIDGVLRLVTAPAAARLDRRRRTARALPGARCDPAGSSGRGIHVQVVTSAVRRSRLRGARSRASTLSCRLTACARARRPAVAGDLRTDLKHIAGRRIAVHCTITRQQVSRPGYLEEFVAFWSAREETYQIRMSLYTPQIGEVSDERPRSGRPRPGYDRLDGPSADIRSCSRRSRLIGRLRESTAVADRVRLCSDNPQRVGRSADLDHPCMFGGSPDCANCGCLASAALAAIARHRFWALSRSA